MSPEEAANCSVPALHDALAAGNRLKFLMIIKDLFLVFVLLDCYACILADYCLIVNIVAKSAVSTLLSP